MEYKGFTYQYELDIEPEENCKILHEAIDQSGKSHSLDFSPYENMTFEAFQMLVDMSFPPRRGCGPWGKDTLMKAWLEHKNQ